MYSRKFDYLLFIFLLFSYNLYPQQSISSLEKERDNNLVKIKEAETILKETEKSKNITIGRLNVINKQIRNRENLITNLNIIFSNLICRRDHLDRSKCLKQLNRCTYSVLTCKSKWMALNGL